MQVVKSNFGVSPPPIHTHSSLSQLILAPPSRSWCPIALLPIDTPASSILVLPLVKATEIRAFAS